MEKKDIEEYLVRFGKHHADGKIYVGVKLADGTTFVGYYDISKNTSYDSAAVFNSVEIFSAEGVHNPKDPFWFISERLLQFAPDFIGEIAIACNNIVAIYAIAQLRELPQDVTEKVNYAKEMSKQTQSKWKEFLDLKKSIILKTLTTDIKLGGK